MKSALLAVATVSALAASASAFAGWGITGDLEHFRWAESTAPSVTETGPRSGIGATWTQDRPFGWQFAYRGRIYFGSVHYNGALLFSGAPASGTTEYSGLVNEGQAIYRFPGNPYGAEFVSGLAWDYWNRQLSADQREQYWVASLRFGFNLDARAATGWFGGAGLKYPFYVHQDAHLTDIGFTSNPSLTPKGALSLYAQAGYRFSRNWSLTGYYDSYRFKESDPTPVVVNPFAPPTSECRTGCRLVQPTSSTDSFGLRLQYSF